MTLLQHVQISKLDGVSFEEVPWLEVRIGEIYGYNYSVFHVS